MAFSKLQIALNQTDGQKIPRYRLKSLSYLRLPFDRHFSRFKFPALRRSTGRCQRKWKIPGPNASWNRVTNKRFQSAQVDLLYRLIIFIKWRHSLLKLNCNESWLYLLDVHLRSNRAYFTKFTQWKYLFRSRACGIRRLCTLETDRICNNNNLVNRKISIGTWNRYA